MLIYDDKTDSRDRNQELLIFILGDQERAQLHRGTGTPEPMTQTESTDDAAGEFLQWLLLVGKPAKQRVKCNYTLLYCYSIYSYRN